MDPATLLQRLMRSGTLSTAQARWVERQAGSGAESVEEVLVRYGLVRTEDLAPQAEPGSGRELVAVAAAQRRCDRMMQAIFDLCVARGVIDEGEYLERLAAAEDHDRDQRHKGVFRGPHPE